MRAKEAGVRCTPLRFYLRSCTTAGAIIDRPHIYIDDCMIKKQTKVSDILTYK